MTPADLAPIALLIIAALLIFIAREIRQAKTQTTRGDVGGSRENKGWDGH